MENPFENPTYMEPRWRALYEQMREDCPRNDCTLYVWYFELFDDLARDYDAFARDMSDTTRMALAAALRKRRHDIMLMYAENYAVQRYKADHAL